MTDLDGAVIAAHVGLWGGTFLADGSVASCEEATRLSIWDVEAGHPATVKGGWGLRDCSSIGSVGDLVLIGTYEDAMLVDPHTGEVVGARWVPDLFHEVAIAAGSPDGQHYVTSRGFDGSRLASLDVRDITCGSVLATDPGPGQNTITDLLWPTNDLILAQREQRMPGHPSVYEAHLAGDPTAGEGVILDFVPDGAHLRHRGTQLLLFAKDGTVTLMTVSQEVTEPLPPLPLAPDPCPSAEVATVPVVGIRDEPERIYAVGDLDLLIRGGRSVWLGRYEFGNQSGFPLDDHRFVLADYELLIDERSSVWLVDLEEQSRTLIVLDRRLEDLDPTGRRLLLYDRESERLSIVDLDGSVVAELASALEYSKFLADGTVAMERPGQIGTWDPSTGSATWVPEPESMGLVQGLEVVGRLVVVGGEDLTFLMDPATGATIGPGWLGAYGWPVAAVSPDGLRFVVNPGTPNRHQLVAPGRLELRDARTGEILATAPGRTGTYVNFVVWATDDMIVPMRGLAGGQSFYLANPEALQADAFEAAPIAMEPLLHQQGRVVQRGRNVLVFDEYGNVALMHFSQSERRP